MKLHKLMESALQALRTKDIDFHLVYRKDWMALLPNMSAADFDSAIRGLMKMGFLRSETGIDHQGEEFTMYEINRRGWAMLTAGKPGEPILDNPHTAGKPVAVKPGSLGHRLWNLLRARQVIDPTTAAETLIDAGQEIKSTTRTVRHYLNRWTEAGCVAASELNPGTCYQRFVLTRDMPMPPATPTQRPRKSA